MPLPTVVFGSRQINTTRLGFGCASLFRIPSRAQRAQLLCAAYEAGIRHFDVAPMYGLGRAEAELGSFARTRRSELTITTKFGIDPTLLAYSVGWYQGPLRRILTVKPKIPDRATAHLVGPLDSRVARLLYARREYNVPNARKSLERSLRLFGSDYIDLLLLHDPSPGSVRSDEVFSYLETARASGLIRSWGITGDLPRVSTVAESFHTHIPVWQVRHNIFLRALPSTPGDTAFITFGVLDYALPRLVHYVRGNHSIRVRWNEAIGADCGRPEVAASFLLSAALRANGSGVVLCSTVQPARIRAAVTAVERSVMTSDPALEAFLHLVDTELCRPATEGDSE
jgi:D-threo-aldose 1-dehydrogenase